MQAIGGQITSQVLNDNFSDLDSRKVDRSELPEISIADYGAVGDGLTDNTPALIATFNQARTLGAAKIRIPAGDYIVDGSAELPSNIHIIAESGAKLRKTTTATEAYLFTIGRTTGTKGYGGGAKNVRITGLTFEGRAIDVGTRRALSLSLHHAQNLIIEDCRFLNCITSDHAIDLCGCDDVKILGCSFEGAFNMEGREYTEAIQIDSSAPEAVTGFTNYDALPTKNVIVRDCKFTPSYKADGTVLNYAPNPIGNHGFTGGMYYEGIVFENNLVLDGWEQTGTNWRAWIHFYGTKDSKFINNRFINTRGVKALALGFYASASGRYNPTTAAAETGTPLPNKNIEIRGNLFQGFNNSAVTDGLVFAYGTEYNSVTYYTENFTVADNTFLDNTGSAMTDGDIGRALIQFNRFKNVHIANNKADLARRMVAMFNGTGAVIRGNISDRITQSAYLIQTVGRLTFQGNQGENLRRPVEFLECTDLNVKDNVFTNLLTTGTDNYSLRMRNLKRCIVQGNVLQTAASIPYAIYFYASPDNAASDAYMFDNLGSGFATGTVNTTGVIPNYTARNS